jgi:hypothetical protein
MYHVRNMLYLTYLFFIGTRASYSDYTEGTSSFGTFHTDNTHPWFSEEVGPSQLSGAPLPTQGTEHMESTPPVRQRRPPDQWTYPTAQVRHQGAQAPKRGRRVG